MWITAAQALPGAKTAAAASLCFGRIDSEAISPTAMAGGNTGLVLCQVGGHIRANYPRH